MLKPDNFFDLSSYSHRALFDGIEYVWQALTKLENYLKAQKLGTIESTIPAGVYFDKKELISIGKGVLIEPGAYIRGPCIIGDGSQIRHGAYIRGNLITGTHCVIGHDTEIKDAIFLNQSQAAHFAYVGNSILGNEVNLGAGFKCANLKLNHEPIHIRNEGKTIDTGLKKLGACIGDRSQMGCNSVTDPGTIIGKDVFWYPCVHFGGVIPHGSIVKGPKGSAIYSKR